MEMLKPPVFGHSVHFRGFRIICLSNESGVNLAGTRQRIFGSQQHGLVFRFRNESVHAF